MKNEKLVMSVVAMILFAISMFFIWTHFVPEPVTIPEVVEEPIPDVIIKVDNVGCHIAEVPVITITLQQTPPALLLNAIATSCLTTYLP